MPKNMQKTPSFEGVAGGNIATLRLPTGLTYNQLYINYSGITLAQMVAIRLVLNGEPIMNFGSGVDLDEMNVFEGRASAAGLLTIDFERYGLRSRKSVELSVIGTGFPGDTSVATLQLEIEIASGVANPVLGAKSRRTAPQPLGFFKKIRKFTYTAPGAGDFEISDLPKGDIINKIIFKGNNIDNVELKRENRIVFDRSADENATIQSDGVRVPSAITGYVFDLTEDGYGAEVLTTQGVHDLRYTLEMSDASTIQVFVEYLGVLEN